MRRLGIALVLATGVIVLAGYVLSVSRYGRTIGLLLRAARVDVPTLRPVARWQTSAVTESERTLSSRRGTLRARVYTPAIIRTRPLLLMGGVHALGIDEPRLRHFASEIARSGTVVVTPELPDLLSYLITGRLTDDIEDAALAVAREAASLGSAHDDGRIGLMGVSFAGGLSIVAAGRPALADRVAFVFSYGGHASLPRVLRYLATAEHPGGEVPPPHDYGGVVLLMNVAPALVPESQVEPLRAGVARFLHASHVAMFDEAQASIEFEEARAMEAPLPDAARHLLHLVNTRNAGELGRTMLPHLAALGRDAALSPETSPVPTAPVFLLHADGDTVIPTQEARALQSTLASRGTHVRLFTTTLLDHAEVKRPPGLGELIGMVRFWAEMPW
jgi:dienelactone hydrolase